MIFSIIHVVKYNYTEFFSTRLYTLLYKGIFTRQGIVLLNLYTIPWQKCYLEVGLEDAR